MKNLAVEQNADVVVPSGTYVNGWTTPAFDLRDYEGVAKVVTNLGGPLGSASRRLLLQESADGSTGWANSTNTGTLTGLGKTYTTTSGTLYDQTAALPNAGQVLEHTIDTDGASRYIRIKVDDQTTPFGVTIVGAKKYGVPGSYQ